MKIKYFVPSSAINSSITPTISTHKIGASMINQKRLEYFKKHYDYTILETYSSLSFLEITTRKEGVFRVYGEPGTFVITCRG